MKVTGFADERGGCILMGRLVGSNGHYIHQEDVASPLQYQVWDITSKNSPQKIVNTTNIEIADCIYDFLQTSDPRWTGDTVGYNFMYEIPAASFPKQSTYRIDVKVSPVEGEVFWLKFDIQTDETYFDG